MNNNFKYICICAGLLFCVQNAHAQQAEFSTGVDLYSTYVWRGVAYSGASWQPTVEVNAGSFTFGAWGSQGYDGFQEMDLYASYEFDFGLSVGATDYYYPGTPYLNEASHAIELNAGYSISGLSLSANYIALGGGSVGSDMYFEGGYDFGVAQAFIGAGDGWHSMDTSLRIVNIGVGTSKELSITDTFSIPLTGAVILNPDSEQLYILVGLSL